MQNNLNPRSYKPLDPVFIALRDKFGSIKRKDKKRYNRVLKSISNLIVQRMKECDILFKSLFTRVFYGGSFYDGLKVPPPNEFDLDLLLVLPKGLEFDLADATNIPGYVSVKLLNHKPSMESLDLKKYKGLDTMINDNHYLETAKVLSWLQSVLQLALNTLNQDHRGRYVYTSDGKFYVKTSSSGPAFTLEATGEIGGEEINLDIDLVPCFVFGADQWPQGGFRQNPVPGKPNFFIVPKPIKGESNSDHFWRLSFQEQERVIIFNKQALKPSTRLIKKMRDFLDHKRIASYYIKTVVLWMLQEQDPSFWRHSSQSYVFMTVLKKYHEFLERKELPYYWNRNCNLLEKIDDATLINMSNKIKSIILDIERHLDDDRFVLATYLVTPQELLQLKTLLPLKTKWKKKYQQPSSLPIDLFIGPLRFD